MQVKFYRYNDISIVPNKLKGATLVYTANIDAPQIMQNLGISFLLDRAIEANIAEYTLKGIRYIANVSYETSGNNMYTYALTLDNLATAWYNNCFNRSNMAARSSIGTFKNDGALLRAEYTVRRKFEFGDISNSIRILMTVLNPVINTSTTTGEIPISQLGTDTYLLTPSQFNSFYTSLSNYTPGQNDPALLDYISSIIKLYILPTSFVQTGLFTTRQAVGLYTVADSGKIGRREFGDTGDKAPLLLDKTAQNIEAVHYSYVIPESDIITLDEDTILGNIQYKLNYGVNFNIPCSYVNNRNHLITQFGYKLYIDYRIGSYICTPEISFVELTEYALAGSFSESIPFIYDSSISDFRQNQIQFANGLTQSLGNVGVGMFNGGLKGGLMTALESVSSVVNAAFDMGTQQLVANSTGTTYKFEIGSNPYRASKISSSVIVSYTPTVNKDSYQNRFGKADMQNRNLMNLSGPVLTSNCILNMNNLNVDIIQNAQAQCDRGIWIL